MNKQALRKTFMEKRKMLEPQEFQHLNNLLCENFFMRTDLAGVQLLHSFLPVPHNREPDTWLIIRRIWTEHPHIGTAVPRISGDGQTLEAAELTDNSELQPNRWMIPEPTGKSTIDPLNIDIVLVPLLVFDRKGNRVGYGKGFYDKFLPLCRPDCRRIGISLFEPIDAIDDTDAFDQKLTSALTPYQYFTF